MSPMQQEGSGSHNTIPLSLQPHIRLVLDALHHYEQTRNPLFLDQAIAAWTTTLNHPDFALADPGIRLMLFNDCAGSFLRRYLAHGHLGDINRAVDAMQQAIDQVPPDVPRPAGLLANTAEILLVRYQHNTKANEEDLNQAIQLYEQASDLIPASAPELPARLGKLAGALQSRYQRSGDVADLHRAVQYYEQASDLTPRDDPALAERLNNLGDCLRTRYLHTNTKEDLDRAVDLGEQVVTLPVPDPLDRAGYRNNLGNALRNRYELLSQKADLERAIQIYREAVEDAPDDTPYTSMFVHNLGVALRDRYYLLGEQTDLTDALNCLQQAVDTAPVTSDYYPGYLSDLGTVLDDWFQHTGSLEELERSVQTHRQAVHQTPAHAPALALHWNNLGNALRNFATRSGKEDDLTQAIEAYRESVAHTPDSSFYRASRLNNLANALKDCSIQAAHESDMHQAIQYYEQALTLLKPHTTEYATVLNNLAGSLYTRYLRKEMPADLDAALTRWQETIGRTPPDSPYLPSRWNNLGQGFRVRYQHAGDPADRERAVHAWKQAIEKGRDVVPDVALAGARNWGNWAFEQGNWSEACDAYAQARELIVRLLSLQILRHNKESWLREAQETFTNAAYALAKKGRLEEAVVAVEEGRAYLLAERLEQGRADLLRLKEIGYSAQYEQYQQATTTWADLLQALSQGETGTTAAVPSTSRIRTARENLDRALAAVRAVPGYEDFFAAPTFVRIRACVTDSPLLYIVITEFGGLALLLRPGALVVTPLFLPELKGALVRQKVLEMGTALDAYSRLAENAAVQDYCFQHMDAVTHWLWSSCMGTIVDAVATQGSATLIPTGLLSLLPLHAAWTPDPTHPALRRYALDQITFTSIPNARALASVRERARQSADDALLVVDDPQPVAEPLGTEGYEVEVARTLFPHHALFRHEQATLDAILEAIPGYSVLHFNGHGYADVGNPLASGLVMAEKHCLTLRHLLEMRLAQARLAVLSACETAIPGVVLPNEVIGLPAGLLQAGFPGVIASLWKVEYTSTMLLMIRFYDLWRDKSVAPPEALRQAQLWLRETRTSEKLSYVEHLTAERELPAEIADAVYDYVFAHMPRTCANPFYWAAFSYTGM